MDTLEFKTKIKELENQLKELLAKYPNQRVDFEFNDDYECYWKDKCYSDGDFGIFYGHNWYCEDRCTVRSIYINDDDGLSFDLSYIAYDHEGNRQEDEELEDVTLDYIIEVTRSSDWDFILSQLNFFAEILIVSPTEESGADVEHKKYCPECGTEVKPEQKFCIECGTRLIESETLAPQPKSDEKSKKKSESKTSKKQKVASQKEEKQSKKKSEQKPDKELDKKLNDLYKMGVACQLGKNGVERSEVLAMEYYQEYLEEAPTSHSKYLDAHYGMAVLCTKMGDEGHSLGMDEDALDWYNDAVEHYEEIVKYPKKPFNDRLLAEVAYDKLRKKMAKLK